MTIEMDYVVVYIHDLTIAVKFEDFCEEIADQFYAMSQGWV